ncbi:MAG: hypothetical protein QOE70_1185 [Chthoniobacter sp.]|nr:hypothetical protein [Chthoniobacter sp.]
MSHLINFPALILVSCALVVSVGAAEDPKFSKAKFTGAPSCSSTSCHGGGTGRNEAIIYEKRDRHAVAYGILGKGTSIRISETLGIVGDPAKAAQCNVCHAPMQAVPLDHLVQKADRGVGCEACHGPAEPWIRFHTRPDVNYQQMVAAGMRDLNDLYGRANTCIACHLNVDDAILKAGHPELFFELDGQTIAQPPHYRDERLSLGPRSWLTGQAAALREISWKLAAKREDRLVGRWKALVWLLRKTEPGKGGLPEGENFAAMQAAADKLAHTAAKATWTKDEIVKLLRGYVSIGGDFRDPKGVAPELRRRAEVLVPAIHRLWRALKKEGGFDPATFDSALGVANLLAGEQDDFEPAKFATALEQLEVAFERTVK